MFLFKNLAGRACRTGNTSIAATKHGIEVDADRPKATSQTQRNKIIRLRKAIMTLSRLVTADMRRRHAMATRARLAPRAQRRTGEAQNFASC